MGVILYVARVNPEPWAVGPLGVGRKRSGVYSYMGRNQQLDAYKEAVKEDLLAQEPKMITGKVNLWFWFWRNRAEWTTDKDRVAHRNEADATNMQKATEDALQGVLIENDRNVVIVTSHVVAQGPEVEGKIVIGIERLQGFSEDYVPQNVKNALMVDALRRKVPVNDNVHFEDPETLF